VNISQTCNPEVKPNANVVIGITTFAENGLPVLAGRCGPWFVNSETLTAISYVEPVTGFSANSSIPNPKSNPSKKENPSKVTASQADIYLNMNCACFWVFLARVGQKNTNVQRDGSTKDISLTNFGLAHRGQCLV
jgi:hypothetical protein